MAMHPCIVLQGITTGWTSTPRDSNLKVVDGAVAKGRTGLEVDRWSCAGPRTGVSVVLSGGEFIHVIPGTRQRTNDGDTMLCLLHNFPSLSFFPCSLSLNEASLSTNITLQTDACLLMAYLFSGSS